MYYNAHHQLLGFAFPSPSEAQKTPSNGIAMRGERSLIKGRREPLIACRKAALGMWFFLRLQFRNAKMPTIFVTTRSRRKAKRTQDEKIPIEYVDAEFPYRKLYLENV